MPDDKEYKEEQEQNMDINTNPAALEALAQATGEDLNIAKDAPKSLGKVETEFDKKQDRKEEYRAIADEMGYKTIAVDSLPSKGRFNDTSMRIKIRSLEVHEIKEYSSLNEDDLMDIDNKITDVLARAVRVYTNQGEVGHGVLKEADKFFLLFAVRDLTMDKSQRERTLILPSECPNCGKVHKRKIDSQIFGWYEVPDGFDKFYSSTERCFVINLPEDDINNLKIYIPSVGVIKKSTSYIMEQEKKKRQGKGGYYDMEFMARLQFLAKDESVITDRGVKELYDRYKSFTSNEFTAVCSIVERLDVSIKPTVETHCVKTTKEGGCGERFTTPIRFPDGYRSIFDFSNITGKLFSSPK